MAENIKGKQMLRDAISCNVKRAMIETKYSDEIISFGQAVVTHHFMENSLQNNQTANSQQHRWQAATPVDTTNK